MSVGLLLVPFAIVGSGLGTDAIAQTMTIQRSESIPVDPSTALPPTDPTAAPPAISPDGTSSGTAEPDSADTVVDIPAGEVESELPPLPRLQPPSGQSTASSGTGETRAALGIVGTVSSEGTPSAPEALDRFHVLNNVCNGNLSLGEISGMYPSIDGALVAEVC